MLVAGEAPGETGKGGANRSVAAAKKGRQRDGKAWERRKKPEGLTVHPRPPLIRPLYNANQGPSLWQGSNTGSCCGFYRSPSEKTASVSKPTAEPFSK